MKALRRIGRILLLGVTAYALVFTSLSVLDTIALRRLQRRLEYRGPSKAFPIAYFRQRVREGMTLDEVTRSLEHFQRVRFFMIPIVGTTDSSIVERFEYPLAWRNLNVDVHYRNGLVWDVYTDGYGMMGAPELDPTRARVLLQSSGSKGQAQETAP